MLVCPHPPISAGKSNIGTKPAFKEIGREENKEKAKKKKKVGVGRIWERRSYKRLIILMVFYVQVSCCSRCLRRSAA